MRNKTKNQEIVEEKEQVPIKKVAKILKVIDEKKLTKKQEIDILLKAKKYCEKLEAKYKTWDKNSKVASKVTARERLKSATFGGLVGAGFVAEVCALMIAIAIAIVPEKADFAEAYPIVTAITMPLPVLASVILAVTENLPAQTFTFKDETTRNNAYSVLYATNNIINERLVSLGFATEEELNNYDAVRKGQLDVEMGLY